MAAPTFVSANSQGFGSSTSWSYTDPPSGVQENDILIAVISADVVTTSVVTAPSGWASKGVAVDDAGTDIRGWIYWKRAGSSEAGPYVWEFSGSQAGGIGMAAYRGCITTGDPFEDADIIGTPAASTHTSPTITTTGTDRKIVVAAMCDESAQFTPYFSGWTNSATERVDAEVNNFVYIGVADYDLASAGNTSCTVTAADSDGGVVFIGALTSVGASVQTLAPSADSADGSWTDQSAGTSLAAAIDEASFSDSDYIQSPQNPSSSGCRVKLAAGTDPSSSSGHEIHWRIRRDNTGQTINMTVVLRQGGGDTLGGGTQIASFNRNGVTTAFASFTEALSAGQADTITDYSDLYLEFYATVA